MQVYFSDEITRNRNIRIKMHPTIFSNFYLILNKHFTWLRKYLKLYFIGTPPVKELDASLFILKFHGDFQEHFY